MKNPVRILVASQKEAKLFAYDKSDGFHLMQYYNDEPFANENEFTSPPGRSNNRMNSVSYALDKDHTQKDDLRHHFIHHVCERMYKDWESNHFKYLCVLTEAKTLGDLRKYLHKSLKELITHEETRNLVGEPDDAIITHLKKTGISEMIKTVL